MVTVRQIRFIALLVVVALLPACQPRQTVDERVPTPTLVSTPVPLPTPTSPPAAVLPPRPTLIPTQSATATLTPQPLPTTRPATAVPATLVRAVQPTVTAVSVPQGWKASKDASGACQVTTPPNWQMGKDFFLAVEQAAPSPIANATGPFPPMGLGLWGGESGSQLPQGQYFQIRTSLVIGDRVCSVWRIKESTEFTADEKSEMERVGKTLQEVH